MLYILGTVDMNSRIDNVEFSSHLCQLPQAWCRSCTCWRTRSPTRWQRMRRNLPRAPGLGVLRVRCAACMRRWRTSCAVASLQRREQLDLWGPPQPHRHNHHRRQQQQPLSAPPPLPARAASSRCGMRCVPQNAGMPTARPCHGKHRRFRTRSAPLNAKAPTTGWWRAGCCG